jgi:hypothetical protein
VTVEEIGLSQANDIKHLSVIGGGRFIERSI